MEVRVTVSNMAWLPKAAFKQEDLFLLKKTLTLVPRVNAQYGKPEDGKETPIVQCWRETDTHVGVPRAFFLKNRKDFHRVEACVAEGAPMMALAPIALRPDDQEAVAAQVVAHLNAGPFAGGLLEAYTSFGKTTVGLEISRRVGRVTAVLVHKEPLALQWRDRILSFLPGARVGFVQGPKCEYRDVDFIICMIQSLAGENGDKYPDEFWHAPGLVIADEVHRLGAPWFSTAAPRFHARRMLGLSATLRRSDGCENVFRWLIGEVIAKPIEKNKVKPIVYTRRTGFQASWDRLNKATGETDRFDLNAFKKPTVLKFIACNRFRNEMIAKDVVRALVAGRNPLVIGERLDILHEIGSMAARIASETIRGEDRAKVHDGGVGITVGYYVGGLSEESRAQAARRTIVCATLQLAKEGIDIQRLDTLFMVTPVSDPVQLIGRIGRPKTVKNEAGETVVEQPKNKPMVVDYVDDDLREFKSLFFSRLKHYKSLGLEIIGMQT